MVKGGKIVDRVNGAHAPELAKKTSAHSQIPVIAPRPPAPKEVSVTSPFVSCNPLSFFFPLIGSGGEAGEIGEECFLYAFHEGNSSRA